MKLMLDIPPVTVTGSSRNQVMSAINAEHMPSVGSNGIYLTPYPGSRRMTIRVYNLEKHRKKVERFRKRGKRDLQSRIIKPAHWVGRYYDIPVAALKLAKIKVCQETRFFRFVKG
jgi:hypothetical protein